MKKLGNLGGGSGSNRKTRHDEENKFDSSKITVQSFMQPSLADPTKKEINFSNIIGDVTYLSEFSKPKKDIPSVKTSFGVEERSEALDLSAKRPQRSIQEDKPKKSSGMDSSNLSDKFKSV
mmetsp:Transcript_33531/g.51532  ORF Transcript_33531/g.51532 Transcript_33531/m.51532 type:complete len:121 (+) Transcript_33531:1543-1905(+)